MQPGLNWKPTFIDDVRPVNVESVRELAASGVMLTSDENVVRVEMNVQYRVTNPEAYLFSVVNADDSLSQGDRQRPARRDRQILDGPHPDRRPYRGA